MDSIISPREQGGLRQKYAWDEQDELNEIQR